MSRFNPSSLQLCATLGPSHYRPCDDTVQSKREYSHTQKLWPSTQTSQNLHHGFSWSVVRADCSASCTSIPPHASGIQSKVYTLSQAHTIETTPQPAIGNSSELLNRAHNSYLCRAFHTKTHRHTSTHIYSRTAWKSMRPSCLLPPALPDVLKQQRRCVQEMLLCP